MNPYVMGFVAGVVSTLFCMFCFEAMVKDSEEGCDEREREEREQ